MTLTFTKSSIPGSWVFYGESDGISWKINRVCRNVWWVTGRTWPADMLATSEGSLLVSDWKSKTFEEAIKVAEDFAKGMV